VTMVQPCSTATAACWAAAASFAVAFERRQRSSKISRWCGPGWTTRIPHFRLGPRKEVIIPSHLPLGPPAALGRRLHRPSYAPLFAPCRRADTLRDLGAIISFRGPYTAIRSHLCTSL
jgi:hypothetical protein